MRCASSWLWRRGSSCSTMGKDRGGHPFRRYGKDGKVRELSWQEGKTRMSGLLQVNDLEISYGEARAVNGISLSLEAGSHCRLERRRRRWFARLAACSSRMADESCSTAPIRPTSTLVRPALRVASSGHVQGRSVAKYGFRLCCTKSAATADTDGTYDLADRIVVKLVAPELKRNRAIGIVQRSLRSTEGASGPPAYGCSGPKRAVTRHLALSEQG
jgi:hypothetical protein